MLDSGNVNLDGHRSVLTGAYGPIDELVIPLSTDRE